MAATPQAVAARRADVGAIAGGAKPHVAFDLAKATYRARRPALRDDRLSAAVARALANELRDVAQSFE
jgi:hypothetical protein